MKRIIVIFLALTTVLAILAGCVGKIDDTSSDNSSSETISEPILLDPPADGTTVLSEEFSKALCRQYWDNLTATSLEPDDIYIKEYRGTFSGAVVVVFDFMGYDGSTAITNEVVGGVVFTYATMSDHYTVWHDNKFYSLLKAYKSGILTLDDLKAIAGVSESYELQPHENAGEAELDKEVSSDIKQQIKNRYAQLLLEGKYSGNRVHRVDSPEDIKVNIAKYHGTYNDAVVVTLWCDCHSYELEDGMSVLEGTTIYYDSNRAKLVWYDGKLYNFQEAYDNNFLSLDDLKTIAERSISNKL